MSTRSAGVRPADCWSVAAFAFALCASVALLVLPIYSQGSESSVTNSAGEVTHTSEFRSVTVFQGEGLGSKAILALPIVLTALPMLLKGHPRIRMVRMIVAIVLLLILPIGYFTIGGFYLASAVAMLIAATRRDAPSENMAPPADRTAPSTTRSGGASANR